MVFHPFCPAIGQGIDEWRCLMCGRPENELLIDPLTSPLLKHCLYCGEPMIDGGTNQTKKYCSVWHGILYRKLTKKGKPGRARKAHISIKQDQALTNYFHNL